MRIDIALHAVEVDLASRVHLRHCEAVGVLEQIQLEAEHRQ
jgi:hypothetical protein